MLKLKFLIIFIFIGFQCAYSQFELGKLSVNYDFGLYFLNESILYNDNFYFSNKNDDLLEYNLKNDSLKIIFKGKNNTGGFPILAPIKDLIVFNNNLFFLSREPFVDYDLFMYDGIQPPKMIPVISSPGSSARDVAIFNNMLYFNAQDENDEIQLFKFNGLTNPELIRGFRTGAYYHNLGNSIEYNGKVYFRDLLSGKGQVLLEYDGISVPKLMYYDVGNQEFVKSPNDFVIYNNKLYFVTDQGLCNYDGLKVSRVFWYTKASNLMVCNNKLFFVNKVDTLGSELWAYEEHKDSLYLVRDINVGPESSCPTNLTVIDNSIYFMTLCGTNCGALWQYNDSKDTLLLLYENPIATILFAYEKSIFFCVMNNSSKVEIWQLKIDEITNSKDLILRKYYSESSNLTSSANNIEIKVYPNPTNGIVDINLDNYNNSILVLTDILGKPILKKEFSNSTQLELGIIKKGIYILEIKQNDKSIIIRKIIKY